MSGSGPFYAPADPYKQPGPFVHPGYPAGDIPMTTPYQSGPPYQSGSPYPSGEPTAPPPPYAETMGGYPIDFKPDHPGSSPYPPSSAGYPPSGPGYPPSNPGYPPSGPGYPPTGPLYTAGGPGYPAAGGPGYPAAGGPGYPAAGGPKFTGYFPGGGVLAPPRPTSSPLNPYQQNTSDDQQQIIATNEDGWAGNSFSDKKIRHVFIRKVYLILMCQLLVTVGFVAVFIFCKPIKRWVHRNSWFYGLSYAVFIVTYIVLVCCDTVRRRWPVNFICLTIFTLAMSYMTGTISSIYDTDIVLISVAITAGVCLAISIFAVQTKIDFTLCSGLIFVLSMVLILFGLACIIVYAVSGPNYILSCVYGGVAAAIFSVFLVFDTQMVVGGKHRRYQLSPEEYIYGALQLYVDIVNLFILLLGLVGKRN